MREKKIKRRADLIREKERDSSGPYRDEGDSVSDKNVSKLSDIRTEASEKDKQLHETDL